ncbi:hypothetical protein CYMTET_33429, partial [Cymbomonas tetramitiformis]
MPVAVKQLIALGEIHIKDCTVMKENMDSYHDLISGYTFSEHWLLSLVPINAAIRASKLFQITSKAEGSTLFNCRGYHRLNIDQTFIILRGKVVLTYANLADGSEINCYMCNGGVINEEGILRIGETHTEAKEWQPNERLLAVETTEPCIIAVAEHRQLAKKILLHSGQSVFDKMKRLALARRRVLCEDGFRSMSIQYFQPQQQTVLRALSSTFHVHEGDDVLDCYMQAYSRIVLQDDDSVSRAGDSQDDHMEVCAVLKGKVDVTSKSGEVVTVGTGGFFTTEGVVLHKHIDEHWHPIWRPTSQATAVATTSVNEAAPAGQNRGKGARSGGDREEVGALPASHAPICKSQSSIFTRELGHHAHELAMPFFTVEQGTPRFGLWPYLMPGLLTWLMHLLTWLMRLLTWLIRLLTWLIRLLTWLIRLQPCGGMLGQVPTLEGSVLEITRRREAGRASIIPLENEEDEAVERGIPPSAIVVVLDLSLASGKEELWAQLQAIQEQQAVRHAMKMELYSLFFTIRRLKYIVGILPPFDPKATWHKVVSRVRMGLRFGGANEQDMMQMQEVAGQMSDGAALKMKDELKAMQEELKDIEGIVERRSRALAEIIGRWELIGFREDDPFTVQQAKLYLSTRKLQMHRVQEASEQFDAVCESRVEKITGLLGEAHALWSRFPSSLQEEVRARCEDAVSTLPAPATQHFDIVATELKELRELLRPMMDLVMEETQALLSELRWNAPETTTHETWRALKEDAPHEDMLTRAEAELEKLRFARDVSRPLLQAKEEEAKEREREAYQVGAEASVSREQEALKGLLMGVVTGEHDCAAGIDQARLTPAEVELLKDHKSSRVWIELEEIWIHRENIRRIKKRVREILVLIGQDAQAAGDHLFK